MQVTAVCFWSRAAYVCMVLNYNKYGLFVYLGTVPQTYNSIVPCIL